MIYEIVIKDSKGISTPIHTHDMEVARTIIKERFFGMMKIDEAIDVCLEATETDNTKTGIVMQFRVRTKTESCIGTVMGIPDDEYFTEEWNSELSYPKSFNVCFI